MTLTSRDDAGVSIAAVVDRRGGLVRVSGAHGGQRFHHCRFCFGFRA